MAISFLDDKSREPGNGELDEALGQSRGLWNELKDHIAMQYKPLTEEWVFSGKNYGWSLRLSKWRIKAHPLQTKGRGSLECSERRQKASSNCPRLLFSLMPRPLSLTGKRIPSAAVCDIAHNDLFNGDIKKPVGLYDLQSFVHQGG